MLVIALKVSVAVLLFATGMSVTVKEITWLWRRPVLLAKSVLAMYVVAPVVAVLMARTLDLPRPTEVALVILAICAGDYEVSGFKPLIHKNKSTIKQDSSGSRRPSVPSCVFEMRGARAY